MAWAKQGVCWELPMSRASTSHLCRNTQGSCPAAVILEVSEPGNQNLGHLPVPRMHPVGPAQPM